MRWANVFALAFATLCTSSQSQGNFAVNYTVATADKEAVASEVEDEGAGPDQREETGMIFHF
jgi:hypothetical protein